MKRLFSAFLLFSTSVLAQQGGTAPPARVVVHAPFAQQLIVREKSLHPEIQKLGLHAVPPGETRNVIIASNLPEKIGKISSANDMRLVAPGQPVTVRVDGGRFFDTFMPLHDRGGTIIGFVVMEVPFATASTEGAAVEVGTVVRDEIQQQVPTLQVLFGPAPWQ